VSLAVGWLLSQQQLIVFQEGGEPSRTRTCDPLVKSQSGVLARRFTLFHSEHEIKEIWEFDLALTYTIPHCG